MSSRELLNLKKKVFNTPQLIMADDFQPIVDYMISPQRTDFKPVEEAKSLARSDFNRDEDYKKYQLEQAGVNPETMQGLIKIEGTLVNRAGNIQACVELTSYEGIKAQLSKQIELGAKEVVLLIDSGGGEAYGMFATAQKIRKMADDADVKLIAYVDGYACSAAYGLASSAHEIIANPQATVGSVGVVVQLMNNSKALEKAGYTRTFVYAGENKIPFDADGEWDKDFLSSIQASINKTYKRFTNLVALNRGMQETDVVKTQASTYDADEAVGIGFVDKLMETDEFFDEYLPSLQQTNTSTQKLQSEENMDKSNQENGIKTIELNTELETVVSLSELATLKEKADAFEVVSATLATTTEGLQTATARIEKLEDDLLSAQADALIASRKAKLEDAIGKENEQLDSILTATASLSEESFNVILSTYAVTFASKEADFKEAGVDTSQDQPRLTIEDKLKLKLQSERATNKA